MTNISKYDVIVVKFPFASSIKYKARPAVVLSSNLYHGGGRDTVIILAISSNVTQKIDFETTIMEWNDAGLLKPSIFKSAIATIEKSYVLEKVGHLATQDIENLQKLIANIC